ncbi:hypothetical protein N9385_02850 [Candidatus Nitrosopelagicus sp.]|nr:hypothetical protein [Candidatus Nitrosopelagicus sp.]
MKIKNLPAVIVVIVSIILFLAVMTPIEIDKQNKLDKITECKAIISERGQEAEAQKCFNEFDELYPEYKYDNDKILSRSP